MSAPRGSSTTPGADPSDPTQLGGTLRMGVLALATLGLGGLIVELVFLRHWGSGLATAVWPIVLLLAGCWVVVIRARTRRAITIARRLALICVIAGGFGIGVHVWANLDAAPLDKDVGPTWDSMPVVQQLFLAATGGVGPAPTLAPGAITEVALMLGLATIGHPALSQRIDTVGAPESAMPM